MGVIQTNVSLLYQLVGKPETYSLYLSIQQMFGVMFNRLWDLRLNNGSWNHAELFFKFHHCKTISYCVYHIRGEINSWCIIILVCQYTLFAITEGGSGCMEQDSEDLTKLEVFKRVYFKAPLPQNCMNSILNLPLYYVIWALSVR